MEKIEELKNRLRESNEPVAFKYKKVDGTIREAYGTLNEKLIPEEHRPKGTGNAILDDSILRYYDIEKNGWRSAIFGNIL